MLKNFVVVPQCQIPQNEALAQDIADMIRGQLEATGCPEGEYTVVIVRQMKGSGNTPPLTLRLDEGVSSLTGKAKPGGNDSCRQIELKLPDGVSSWEVAARLMGRTRLTYANGSQRVNDVFGMLEKALYASRLTGAFEVKILGSDRQLGVRGKIVVAPDEPGHNFLLLMVWPQGKIAYDVSLSGKTPRVIASALITKYAAVPFWKVIDQMPMLARMQSEAEGEELWGLDIKKVRKGSHSVKAIDLLIAGEHFPLFTLKEADVAFRRAKGRTQESTLTWESFRDSSLIQVGKYCTVSDRVLDFLALRAMHAADLAESDQAAEYLRHIAGMEKNAENLLSAASKRKESASGELDSIPDRRGILAAEQEQIEDQIEALKRRLEEISTEVTSAANSERTLQVEVSDATTEMETIVQATTSRPKYLTLLEIAKEAVKKKGE